MEAGCWGPVLTPALASHAVLGWLCSCSVPQPPQENQGWRQRLPHGVTGRGMRQ